MKYVGNVQSQANAEVYATASGTLPNGKPVIVNSDGTVSVVASSSASQSVTSRAEFDDEAYAEWVSVYDTNSNRVVAVGADNSNAGIYVWVGTVNASSISWGSKVSASSGAGIEPAVVFDSTNNKIVVAYTDSSNTNYVGKAVVGTVDSSDNSISFGSAATFNSGQTFEKSAAFDANAGKTVIVYRDESNSNYGTAVVSTVSGTSISFGSETVYESADSRENSISYDANAQKLLISFADSPNDFRGTSIVATVSGTSISFGSAAIFESGAYVLQNYPIVSVYDSNAQKTVIYYTGSSDGYAIVATISGTSVSFGSRAESEGTGGTLTMGSVGYDTTANKTVFAYRNSGDNVGYVNTGTISGTSISFGTRLSIAGGAYFYSCTYSPDANRTAVMFRSTDSDAESIVFRAAGTDVNLTAENFLGITNGVVDYVNVVIGSTATFSTGTPQTSIRAAFDSNSNRMVIAYRDTGNSNYATAVVGSVNAANNTISFGTPVVFNAASSNYVAVTFDSNSNKVVMAYRDEGNSDYGMAIVGTVDPSNNSISFGSEAVFQSGNTNYIAITFDSSSNKVVIASQNQSNSLYGTAIVGTVSGTSISFGSAVVFESARAQDIALAFDSNSNKVVIAYKDYANSQYGTSIVGTVSGTSISFGSAVVFESATIYYVDIAYDVDAQKVVIVYRDDGNSYQGTAIVGTISGTGISFGSSVVFDPLTTGGNYANPGITYDTTLDKVLISYYGPSADGQVVTGTVSGTSISFESPVEFSDSSVGETDIVYDTNSSKSVICYRDSGDSNKGKALVYNPSSETRGSTASGSTAIIQAGGAISTLQTGLTAGQQYFVQLDGTLGLTAASPSVLAGTAVSATDLIVKG